MATETGVWDIQDVRDKQLASEWSYTATGELFDAFDLMKNKNGRNSFIERKNEAL